MKSARRPATALAQRMVFAFERFGEHELANHAAAGAYAFLLSAIPSVLLALGLATAFFRARPEALSEALGAAVSLLGPLASSEAVGAFISRPLGALAAAAGALSLLYSARLLIVTIQRGIRVVWATSGKSGLVRENLLGFALELAALVAVVAVLAASEGARLLAGTSGQLMGGAMQAAARAAGPLVLVLFVYLTYRFAPPSRPPRRVAAVASLLCVILALGFSALFGLMMGRARYDLLYGILGNLIVLLANVYFFFFLFFAFAELVYIEEHFDALLFTRFQRCLRAASKSKVERALFNEPERLARLYGRPFAAGEKVFSVGEGGREAYFVKSGGIGIYIPSARGEIRLATVEAGEIFGEMALIRGEARSATARAEVDSYALVIPPAIFEIYLKTDDAHRRVAEILSERLRRANERIGGGQ